MTTEAAGELLMSAEDVCEALNIGRSTLYRLKSTGRVPRPVKLGGSVRWRRKELEAWIAAGCPPQTRWDWESD